MRLDLRALAALRIGLGLMVLLDVLLRLRDLEAFYTDAGALPRATLLQIPHPTLFSLYMAAGTSAGAAFLMLLLAASALGLTLGWRTRLCAVATWLGHIALKHRNPLILDVGDLELGLALFWIIFLPVAARWSMDARANPEWSELPDAYRSVATTGYLLQISLIYLMGCLNKSDPVWRETGLALAQCLNSEQFATAFGRSLLAFPDLLRSLTFAVLALELAIAILLWVGRLRPVAVVMILVLQLGIAATMDLGLIVPSSLVVTLGLWPGRVFTWLGRLRFPPGGVPGPCPGYALSRPTKVFLVLVQVYVVFLNYALTQTFTVPMPIKVFGYLTRQHQDWSMFAPAPETEDGWHVGRGELLNGQSVDLLRDGPASLDKPARLFPNHRWRLWLVNLEGRRDRRVDESYAAYLARRWNATHPGPERVRRVELIYVSRRGGPVTLYDYQVPGAQNEVVIP